MSIQRDKQTLPIASAAEIEHTARQLMRTRYDYLSGLDSGSTSRPLILDSWRRCDALGVNPARRCAPLAIACDWQLVQLRDTNELLLRAARPVLRHLVDFFADSGYVVVLSDASGRLIEVEGDTAIQRRLARIDFMPGGAWSEAAAGTNAIGTALALNHSVQLMAAEHYCDGWQDLTCTAAPIRHPFTGDTLGVLDITGDYRLIRPFLTGFLSVAALEIQQALRVISAPPQVLQRRHLYRASSSPLDRKLPVEPMPERQHLRPALPVPTRNPIEQGASDVERLAAATSTISASLDPQITLEQIAQQTAYVLNVACAAVYLFDDNTFCTPHVWSQGDADYDEWGQIFDILLHRSEGVVQLRERGEVVIINDLRGSPLLPLDLIEQLNCYGIALIPLVTARGVIGCIAAPNHSRDNWQADDMRLGLALASHAATALENAYLFAALQQHNRHTEALNAVAQFLSSLPDPGMHLELVLERIAAIMDFDGGVVLRCRQHDTALSLVAHYQLPVAPSSRLGASADRALCAFAEQVDRSGEPLLLCGHTAHPADVAAVLTTTGFCDLMAVPLVAGGSKLGVLFVGTYRHRQRNTQDVRLFTTIGQQLALALYNAELLREASDMEALREADRLKSLFLAAVSHDLRSPLTAIRTSVEGLLDRRSARPGVEHEQLLNIAGQSGRLTRLVDQLLDLSRIEAGALRLDHDWTEIPALLKDTITSFVDLNPGCQVEYVIGDPMPLQYIDPDGIVQVLWNLLENGWKYTSQHTPLHVEAQCIGEELHIRVQDRGPGIPPRDRERIFEHFYRLQRDHSSHAQGSGLGLAICRGIVAAHGGRIWVDERTGGGSSFCIALPLPTTTPTTFEMLHEHDLLQPFMKGAGDGIPATARTPGG
jgi:two-component system sensor histidine kinase KdpD